MEISSAIQAAGVVLAAAAIVIGRYVWERLLKKGEDEESAAAVPAAAPIQPILLDIREALRPLDRMADSLGDIAEFQRRHRDDVADIASAIGELGGKPQEPRRRRPPRKPGG